MKNLISIALVLLVAIVGCKLPGSPSSNSSHSTNSANINSSKDPGPVAPDTTTVADDPRKDVSDAFQKFRSVPFVTVTTESTDPDSNSTLEKFSAADESYSRSSESGEDSEMTIVGKETFSKMNSHWPWRKESGSSESAADRFYSRYDLIVRSLSDFTGTSEGQEMIEEQAANIVNLTPIKQSSGLPSSIKIWIGEESGLPLKLVMELDKGTKKNTSTFDFQSSVKIERPVEGKK